VEHVPDEYGERIPHRLPPREAAEHVVHLDPNSKLARLLGTFEFPVISWHHQAVGRIAEGLKVVGRSGDDLIEAAEMPDHPWLICVQWHPELSAHQDPIQQRLFNVFVDAVRAKQVVDFDPGMH
jgi:putative glutamine amidotransferase